MDIWFIVSVPLWIAASFLGAASALKVLGAILLLAEPEKVMNALSGLIGHLFFCFLFAYMASRTMGA